MSDTIQTDLQVPNIDWNHYDAGGGGAKLPPQAKDANGNYITYYAQLPQEFTEAAFDKTQQGFLKVHISPLVLVNNGEGIDGFKLLFQSASAKQYTTREGKPLNASQLGNFLESADVAKSMQPSDLDSYKAAVRATAGKVIPIRIEWELYDKQTRVQVLNKYDEFPGAPGEKQPVVKTDDGRTLYARAKVKQYVATAQA